MNSIICGDNVLILKSFPENFIDLTVTSPPYDNLRKYKGFSWDYKELIPELYRVTKIGGVVVWIVNDATVNGSETGSSFEQALYFKTCGFKLHDTMIYKSNIWEYVTGGNLSTKDKIAFEHPAIFPEKLAEDHILSWSNENDIVFDPFCGSGTTLKMAKLNKRNYIGIDISLDYCQLSKQRVELV